ncbi:hypothetical protein [Leptospira weilii]|nr:hypothetical protein [Leptospira weilii]
MSYLEIVDAPFRIGMEYEAIKSFDTFQQSKRYTYVGYNALYDDRSVVGYEHFFHDAENDKLHGWRSKERSNKKAVSFFNRVGGWEKPVSNSVTPIDSDGFDVSQGNKNLQTYIPYFKSLIEGEKDIRNWYEWLDENEKLLEKILSRGEYLRWKIYPIQEMEKFLRESKISFRRGYRYLWIDSDRLKYYLKM